jgi:hypothetical protein
MRQFIAWPTQAPNKKKQDSPEAPRGAHARDGNDGANDDGYNLDVGYSLPATSMPKGFGLSGQVGAGFSLK